MRGYGTRGGISPKGITDQITGQNTPYCYELGTTAINDIRVLDVIRRRDREHNSRYPLQKSSGLSSLQISQSLQSSNHSDVPFYMTTDSSIMESKMKYFFLISLTLALAACDVPFIPGI
jgi:hypothetical protein